MSTFPVLKLAGLNGAAVHMPGVAFGVGTAHYKQDVKDVVTTALKVGFRHLDNAAVYENESSSGEASSACNIDRKDLFVTTKVLGGLGDISKALDESLKKLRLDYVDLYLIHSPTTLGRDGIPDHKTAWAAMQDCLKSGKCRAIGVSNFRISDLKKLEGAEYPPVINQIELHPYVWKASEPLLEYMKQHNIMCAAYGPTTSLNSFAGGPVDPVVEKIAKDMSDKTGKKAEPSQVLLKLISQHGHLAVTTSSKDWRMKQQLEAGALPDLSQDEISAILEAGAKQHKRKFMKHMDSEE